MKSIYILLLAIFSTFSLYAQHEVIGRVIDHSENMPIEYATIALLRNDSSIVSGTISNESGNFLLENISADIYLLQVSYVGYRRFYKTVRIPADCNQGTILLKKDLNLLEEVTVTATRPLLEHKADRYIVNVESHILSAGRNALEVLGQTPGVVVSNDGKVSVMGKEVDIYIDGRPSRLSGENLKMLLSSTQGESISRIEVITNPSSRYDASGAGGIVDIRTKKGLEYGLNGSINLGYRQGRKDQENGGVLFNYRKEKLNLYGNYSLDRVNAWKRIEQINRMESEGVLYTYDQKSEMNSEKAGINQQYRIGVDFFINENHTLGTIYSGYHRDRLRRNIEGETTITPALDDVVYSKSSNWDTNPNNGNQVNLNYQGLLSRPGQRIDIDLDYARFETETNQHNLNNYYGVSDELIKENEQLRHTNLQTIEVWSGKVDYSHPLWEKARIDLGGKASQSRTDNDLRYQEFLNGSWGVDHNNTNHFIYTEQVHAGYISLSQSLNKFTIQAGLRGEYTHSKGDQKTINVINKRSYFDLFPTVYLNYRPSDDHNLNLSYGRRIMRPAYGQLNPFEIKIDAYSFNAGNPDLKPMYMHNLSFSYSFRQRLMAHLNFSYMTDVFSEKPIQDPENDRYGLTYTNFGKKPLLSLMVNYRRNPFSFWNINFTTRVAYVWNRSQEEYGTFDNSGFYYEFHLSNNFTIGPTWSAELNGIFSSKEKQSYIIGEAYGVVSLGVRKSLLKDKLSLSLTANDIFNTMKMKMSSYTPEVDYKIKMQADSRWVALGVRYMFGSDKVKSNRNRSSGIEEEKMRAQ